MENAWVDFLGLGIPVLAAAVAATVAYLSAQRVKRSEQRQQREEALRRHKQQLYPSHQEVEAIKQGHWNRWIIWRWLVPLPVSTS